MGAGEGARRPEQAARRKASSTWKNSVGREIIEVGAYAFVWVIGIYCCIKFMTMYEYYLKPLFLAAVFISVLEAFVNMFETLLLRLAKWIWKLVHVVLQPAKWPKWCPCFRFCCSPRNPPGFREDTSDDLSVHCNQEDVPVLWSERQTCINRWVDRVCWLLALVLTFSMIGIVVWGMYFGASREIQSFHDNGRGQAYVWAGKSLTNDLVRAVEDLPTDILPQSVVNKSDVVVWWKSLIGNYTENITEHGAEIFDQLEVEAFSLFSGTASITTSFISQTLFFLLYSLFWLVEPLGLMMGPPLHKPQIGKNGELRAPAKRRVQPAAAPARDAEKPLLDSSGAETDAEEPEEGGGGTEPIGAGDTVRVRRGVKLKAFKEEEGTPPTELDPKREGVVERIDEDGHALIAFKPTKGNRCYELLVGSAAEKHWVSHGELPNLKVKEPATRPSAAETVEIIQKYFELKTYVNFATSVAYYLLFKYFMRVDLKFVLVVIAFFLGFIPELGFIAQVFVSLPVVLLSPVDSTPEHMGEIDSDSVMCNLRHFMFGSFVIKFAVNNVIETLIMQKNKVLSQGGQEVHAVLILFMLALGGEIWGWIGMLLAVPGISLGRLVYRLAVDTVRSRERPDLASPVDLIDSDAKSGGAHPDRDA